MTRIQVSLKLCLSKPSLGKKSKSRKQYVVPILKINYNTLKVGGVPCPRYEFAT